MTLVGSRSNSHRSRLATCVLNTSCVPSKLAPACLRHSGQESDSNLLIAHAVPLASGTNLRVAAGLFATDELCLTTGTRNSQ